MRIPAKQPDATCDFTHVDKTQEGHLNITVTFDDQRHGYDKEQVDSYIDALTAEYNAMYDSYCAAAKENELYKDYTDTIGRALLRSEILARQIVEKAEQEARAIIGKARTDIETILHQLRASQGVQ